MIRFACSPSASAKDSFAATMTFRTSLRSRRRAEPAVCNNVSTDSFMARITSVQQEFVYNDLHARTLCYVLQADTTDHMLVAVDKKSVLDPLSHIFRIGVVLADE